MTTLCTICGEPVTLIPSAAERARKVGGKPSDYTALFTEHATCTVAKRSEQARLSMKRQRKLP